MNTANTSTSLDSMIAQFNIMTTDFIFSQHQCKHRAMAIANQLHKICQHMELAFFPDQQIVYFKMLKVWKALAYGVDKEPEKDLNNDITDHEEQTQKTERARSVSMH